MKNIFRINMFEYINAVVVIAIMLRHFSKTFRFNLGDVMFVQFKKTKVFQFGGFEL